MCCKDSANSSTHCFSSLNSQQTTNIKAYSPLQCQCRNILWLYKIINILPFQCWRIIVNQGESHSLPDDCSLGRVDLLYSVSLYEGGPIRVCTINYDEKWYMQQSKQNRRHESSFLRLFNRLQKRQKHYACNMHVCLKVTGSDFTRFALLVHESS